MASFNSTSTTPPVRPSINSAMPSEVDFEISYSINPLPLNDVGYLPPITLLQQYKYLIDYYQNQIVQDRSQGQGGQAMTDQKLVTFYQTEYDKIVNQYEYGYEFTGSWSLLQSINLPAEADPSGMVQQTITSSFSQEQSTETNYEVGVSLTVGTGDISPVKFEASVTASFGQAFSLATNITSEESSTITMPSVTYPYQAIFDIWQRILYYQPAYRPVKTTDWRTYGPVFKNSTAFWGLSICKGE